MNQRAQLNFDAIRQHFDLPVAHPTQVEAAAAQAHDRFMDERVDARAVEFVTIDPPGSLDLDQAVCIRRTETGFELNYAIADVSAFVRAGDPIDVEAHERGQTVYLPDGNVPLHPRVLSEQRASLVAGEDRPAIWWQITTDALGRLSQARVRRATVHVRERLDYPTLQAQLDSGVALPAAVALLPEWGRLRERLARERGAIELQLPEQDLELVDGNWQLRLEPRTQVDAWNAQCSLATGIAAATIMCAAQVGVIRTLPAPDEATVSQFRELARSLGMDAAESAQPGEILAELDPHDAAALALHAAATKLLRGARYIAFDGAAPSDTWHAGVAATYAHATAPLRRLVDRYANDCCVAVTAGQWVSLAEPAPLSPAPIPPEVREGLDALPGIMQRSAKLASDVDNAAINLGEAVALEHRVGELFEATLLRPRDGKHDAEIFVLDPPVIAQCAGDVPAGERVAVRLTLANPATRKVRFAYPAN